jgi:hypothetical protein
MKLIKAHLRAHIGNDQQGQGQTARQSDEVDSGVCFVFDNIPGGRSEEVSEHMGWLV